MKKQFILFCMAAVMAAPICLGQANPSKSDKSATNEAAVMGLEKAVSDAYKNKQTNEFKKYLATDFSAIDAGGIKNTDAEVADMQRTDLRNYSFADTKVVFPSADVAVITYKVTMQSTSAGQDTSGTYNAATVWTKKGGKWLALVHTFVKAQ